MRRALLTVGLVVCGAGVAAADPPAPRASVGLAVGAGEDETADDVCGGGSRTVVAVAGTLGRGPIKLAAGLAHASLDLPDVYCDLSFSYGEASAHATQAGVGAAMTTAPATVRLHARLLVGLEVLHVESQDRSWDGTGSPDAIREDTEVMFGPMFELTGGVAYVWRDYWVGPELAVGYAHVEGQSLAWRFQPGAQLTFLLAVGVDLD